MYLPIFESPLVNLLGSIIQYFHLKIMHKKSDALWAEYRKQVEGETEFTVGVSFHLVLFWANPDVGGHSQGGLGCLRINTRGLSGVQIPSDLYRHSCNMHGSVCGCQWFYGSSLKLHIYLSGWVKVAPGDMLLFESLALGSSASTGLSKGFVIPELAPLPANWLFSRVQMLPRCS